MRGKAEDTGDQAVFLFPFVATEEQQILLHEPTEEGHRRFRFPAQRASAGPRDSAPLDPVARIIRQVPENEGRQIRHAILGALQNAH